MAQLYGVTGLQLAFGIIGLVVSFIAIIGIVVFWKLLKHQIKIWALAKKGYIQVRHVREDMNEDNYFIRIKDEHYTVAGGVYMEQKDAKTNANRILPVFNYDLLSKKKDAELTELEKQLKTFFENIKNNKIMDIKTLSWGIPTITYFGNNPNPVNYRDIKKIYDAKNISAMIKRILMTKEWKLVRMVLILASVAIVLSLVLGFLNYGIANKSADSLGQCLYMLNTTSTKYDALLNSTMTIAKQSSSVII